MDVIDVCLDRVLLSARAEHQAPDRIGGDEAFAALEQLPTHLRQFKPYVRTLEALREDQRRAEGS